MQDVYAPPLEYPSPQPSQPLVNSSVVVIPSDISQQVLDELIQTKGNLRLVAERLGCTQADIVQAIKPVSRELKEYMQVVATLELFSFMPILHKTLVENLSALEPGDAVNAYMKLMDQISRITDDKTLTVNVNDAAWRHLSTKFPKEVIDVYLAEQTET